MKQVKISLKIKLADHARGLRLPRYETPGAAGMDLLAAVEESITIEPGGICLIPTGIHVALPEGYELQIRPRSGLALKFGIGLLNSPGTIDADYRGEIKVIMINQGEEPFEVKRGDRIAQMVPSPVPRLVLEEAEDLPPTGRDEGGFGHTGRNSGF